MTNKRTEHLVGRLVEIEEAHFHCTTNDKTLARVRAGARTEALVLLVDAVDDLTAEVRALRGTKQ